MTVFKGFLRFKLGHMTHQRGKILNTWVLFLRGNLQHFFGNLAASFPLALSVSL